MKTTRIFLALFTTVLFTACGGGGSSSGGGGGSNKFAGVYSGNHNVKFTSSGSSSQGVVFLTLTVNGDGTFKMVDGDGGADTVPVSGKLNADRFDASATRTISDQGIKCTLTVRYQGTIKDNRAKGTTSGSGPCSGSGRTINVTSSGSFDIAKTGKAKAPRNSSIKSNIISLIK